MIKNSVNTVPKGRSYEWRLLVGCLLLLWVWVPSAHARNNGNNGHGGKAYEYQDLGTLSPEFSYRYNISSQWVHGHKTVYYIFEFSIENPGRIEIYTKLASGSKMNPKGELYSAYTKIKDNNGGEGKNFSIETCLDREGTYFLVISGPHSSNFELMVSLSPPGDGCGDDGDDDDDDDGNDDDTTSCMDIADAPLTTQITAAPPMIMFLLDDSGSMDFDILCDSDGGDFRYGNGGSSGYISGDANIDRVSTWANDVREYWVTQWSGYNRVYYNPEVTYAPWPTYENADPDTTRKHPVFNYGNYDMDSDSFVTFSWGLYSDQTLTLRYAHYYVKSGDDLYLVNLDKGTARYYSVDANRDYSLEGLTELSTPPEAIRIKDYDATLQTTRRFLSFCPLRWMVVMIPEPS